MKLDKVCNIDKFSEYYDNDINQKLPHSIKFVVDDIILDVNKVILSWWSAEFGNRADDESELFLTEFTGKYVNILIKIICHLKYLVTKIKIFYLITILWFIY